MNTQRAAYLFHVPIVRRERMVSGSFVGNILTVRAKIGPLLRHPTGRRGRRNGNLNMWQRGRLLGAGAQHD